MGGKLVIAEAAIPANIVPATGEALTFGQADFHDDRRTIRLSQALLTVVEARALVPKATEEVAEREVLI
jgi:hypothetical protein